MDAITRVELLNDKNIIEVKGFKKIVKVEFCEIKNKIICHILEDVMLSRKSTLTIEIIEEVHSHKSILLSNNLKNHLDTVKVNGKTIHLFYSVQSGSVEKVKIGAAEHAKAMAAINNAEDIKKTACEDLKIFLKPFFPYNIKVHYCASKGLIVQACLLGDPHGRKWELAEALKYINEDKGFFFPF